ncbi:MAG: MFS transporter [Anaerolineae bacterium]|nr:MFS transporter [Anaerolineae bacterium]
MLTARLFYFLFFAGMASLMPYFAMHFQHRGMTGTQVGILTGLLPFVGMITAPLWSALADTTRRHKAVLLLTTGGAALSVAAMTQAETFAGLLVTVFLFAVCLAPIIPIVDSAVLTMLGTRKTAYGRVRLLGPLGPALAGPLVANWVGRWGLNMSFYSFTFCFLLLFLLLTQLKIRVDSLSVSFSRGVRHLLGNAKFGGFLLVAFLGMVGYAAIMTYLYIRMEELGATKTLMGFALTMGTIGELPFLFLSTKLLKRFGARGTLISSLTAMSIMLVGFSLARAPWILLALQLLHGTAFSGMAISGVAYADEVAPAGMSTTAQGIFNAVYGGLALAVGAFTSSVVRDNWGSPVMFRVASASALLGLVIFLATSNRVHLISQELKPI